MNPEYFPITLIIVTCLLLEGLFAALHQPVPSVVDHVLLVTIGILVPSDFLIRRKSDQQVAATADPAATGGAS